MKRSGNSPLPPITQFEQFALFQIRGGKCRRECPHGKPSPSYRDVDCHECFYLAYPELRPGDKT